MKKRKGKEYTAYAVGFYSSTETGRTSERVYLFGQTEWKRLIREFDSRFDWYKGEVKKGSR